MIFMRETKHWQRVLFPDDPNYVYREKEEEKYEEFLSYIKENDSPIPEDLKKSVALRFVQANDYKISVAVQNLVEHLEWKRTYLPITLSEASKEGLMKGYIYFYGRDKAF